MPGLTLEQFGPHGALHRPAPDLPRPMIPGASAPGSEAGIPHPAAPHPAAAVTASASPGGTAPSPLPGVVVVHGAKGPMAGWSHRFAAILAAHGLRALPRSYGAGDFFGAEPELWSRLTAFLRRHLDAPG